MKKLSIVLIIALIAAVLGAPYVNGKVAETKTLKIIEQLNQAAGEYGAAEIVSYDRGFRSTEAHYRYTPPAAIATLFPEQTSIEYTCKSAHGITGIDYNCALEGESAYSEFVKDHLDGKDPLSVYGTVSAFGTITQNISLDRVKNLKVDEVMINLPEALVSVTTNAQMQDFDISGSSSAFSLQGAGERLSVGEVIMGGDLHQVKDQLFTGDFTIAMDHFDMQSKDGASSFKNVNVMTQTSQSGDNLNSSADFSIGELKVPGGIVQSVEDVKFSFVAKGIDTEAMLEYQALASQMQRDALAAIENQQEPPANAVQMAALMPIVERMLKQGLEINGQLDAELDGEPNRVQLDAKLLQNMTIAQFAMFLSQPDEALKNLDINLATSLNKKLVDSQPIVASMISQSPLVKQTDDNYALDLKLGEKIELNGKTMKFQELQMLVFSSIPSQ